MKIYSGHHGFDELKSLINQLDLRCHDIILITGQKSFDLIPNIEDLKSFLNQLKVFTYKNPQENPIISDIFNAITYFDSASIKPKLIIAIGGGSVLDFSKILRFCFENQIKISADLLNLINTNYTQLSLFDLPKPSNIELIAIPTTCGTGSEVTQFATFYENKIKQSLDHFSLIPNQVILDPVFIQSLPKTVKAHTIADAICQSIESFWNTRSTKESKNFAIKALSIYQELLKNDLILSNDAEINLQLLQASHFAGQAIQITRTTSAHAVSYPLTALFGIPHGQAVALSLPYFFEFNEDINPDNCQDPRGYEFVQSELDKLKKLLNIENPSSSKNSLIKLFKLIGLKTKLSDFGISEMDLSIIADHSFNPSRMKNNPRMVSKDDLLKILKESL